MSDVHVVKISDLSTMEREVWEHIMVAAKGPHNAVNAQYAIAFALMSQSDTMATQCKILNDIESDLDRISMALEHIETNGISRLKRGFNAVADAIANLAVADDEDDDLIG